MAVQHPEAMRAVIRLYNTEWLRLSGGIESRDAIAGALEFYGWLQTNHPEVLDFDYPGDRYQIVKTWVGLK